MCRYRTVIRRQVLKRSTCLYMSTPEIRLLILEREWTSRRPLTYRGVNRYPPSYQQAYPADAPVNRAFLWFCDHIGTAGIVHDLNGARNLVNEYKGLSPAIDLQIVEPVLEGTKPRFGGDFLGWDLALRGIGFSLILWGIHEMEPEHRNDKLGVIGPLVLLTREHFRNLLNENGLFGALKDARFCLECFRSLDQLRAGLWESDPFELYKIVAVYVVE
jgi:hypothetical protein